MSEDSSKVLCACTVSQGGGIMPIRPFLMTFSFYFAKQDKGVVGYV